MLTVVLMKNDIETEVLFVGDDLTINGTKNMVHEAEMALLKYGPDKGNGVAYLRDYFQDKYPDAFVNMPIRSRNMSEMKDIIY